MSHQYSALAQQIHNEEVLYNEATRMSAVSDVLESIKEKIEKYKAELNQLSVNIGNQIMDAMN